MLKSDLSQLPLNTNLDTIPVFSSVWGNSFMEVVHDAKGRRHIEYICTHK